MKRPVWFIYVLRDPRDGVVRYVGKTTNKEHRLKQHVWESARANTGKRIWIRGLCDAGLLPIMDIVQRGTGSGVDVAERRWMARQLKAGAPLLNSLNPPVAHALERIPGRDAAGDGVARFNLVEAFSDLAGLGRVAAGGRMFQWFVDRADKPMRWKKDPALAMGKEEAVFEERVAIR